MFYENCYVIQYSNCCVNRVKLSDDSHKRKEDSPWISHEKEIKNTVYAALFHADSQNHHHGNPSQAHPTIYVKVMYRFIKTSILPVTASLNRILLSRGGTRPFPCRQMLCRPSPPFWHVSASLRKKFTGCKLEPLEGAHATTPEPKLKRRTRTPRQSRTRNWGVERP